jgi:cobalt-zinc-cadmium efflux system outer membrane protein
VARLESEALQARVELDRSKHLQEHARRVLAASVGGGQLEGVNLSGALDDVLGVSKLENLFAELRATEAVEQSEVEKQKARLKLAKKERIPDLNLDLFYRRLESTKQDAFDVGLRIPLPVFNRPGQKVRAANADVAAAEARLENTRIQTRLQEHEAEAHLEIALQAARLLRDEIRPRADKILKTATARYKEGDMSLAELLPRRGEWLRVQENYLNSLRMVVESWTLIQLN